MLNQLKRRLHDAYDYLKRTVRRFWRRLLNEPGYADAVANFVTYGAELLSPNPALVGLIHRVGQALAGLARATSREREQDGDSPWHFGPGWAN